MSSIECDNSLMSKAPPRVVNEKPPTGSRADNSDEGFAPKGNLDKFKIPRVRVD